MVGIGKIGKSKRFSGKILRNPKDFRQITEWSVATLVSPEESMP